MKKQREEELRDKPLRAFKLESARYFLSVWIFLWKVITSESGFFLITEDAPSDIEFSSKDTGESIQYRVTTFKHQSHFRMQWKLPEWENHSILQIRLTSKGPEKTTVTFHQEKLPNEKTRNDMRKRWKNILGLLTDKLTESP